MDVADWPSNPPSPVRSGSSAGLPFNVCWDRSTAPVWWELTNNSQPRESPSHVFRSRYNGAFSSVSPAQRNSGRSTVVNCCVKSRVFKKKKLLVRVRSKWMGVGWDGPSVFRTAKKFLDLRAFTWKHPLSSNHHHVSIVIPLHQAPHRSLGTNPVTSVWSGHHQDGNGMTNSNPR